MAEEDPFECEEASNLLCDETDDALLDEFDDNAENNNRPSNGSESEEQLMELLRISDEGFALMVERESGFLPRSDYVRRLRSGELGLGIRQEGFDWILKAHSHLGYGASTFCLSMNYLDRYLSMREIPEDQAWHVQLVAVACFSIAAKVDDTYVPPLLQLQVGEPRYIFEPKTIQRMELLVLSTLKWRMIALTPCSFIEYILVKIMGKTTISSTIISRSSQLIFRMIEGVNFLEFTPSQIAAAVGIAICGKMQAVEIDAAISSFVHLDKDRVLKCVELINDLWLISRDHIYGGSVLLQPVPHSPIGVLDTMSFSFKSVESPLGLTGNPTDDCLDTKRRRTY